MSRVKKANTSGAGASDDPIGTLTDRRNVPIFIHSSIDDMTDLTPNDFRVYMHLARRADKNGVAFPKYQSIGDHCFGSVYKNPGVRRRHAIASVKNLINAGLISKKGRIREDGSQTSNVYMLLEPPTSRNHDTSADSHDGGYCGVPGGGTVEYLQKGTPLEGTPKEDIAASPLARSEEAVPSVPAKSRDEGEGASTGARASSPFRQKASQPDRNGEGSEKSVPLQPFVDAFVQAVSEIKGYEPEVTGETWAAAKKIAAAKEGFTPDDVKFAIKVIFEKDKDDFWANKTLKLSSVFRQMPAIIAHRDGKGKKQRKSKMPPEIVDGSEFPNEERFIGWILKTMLPGEPWGGNTIGGGKYTVSPWPKQPVSTQPIQASS